jgi:hypothetical protein
MGGKQPDAPRLLAADTKQNLFKNLPPLKRGSAP